MNRAALAVVVWCGLTTGCGEDEAVGGPSVFATTQSPSSDSGETTVGSGGSSADAEATAADTATDTTDPMACTDRPTGRYADCVNASTTICDSDDAVCLVNSVMEPSWGVCFKQCETDCDCWAEPNVAATAVAACVTALQEGETACILDCGGQRTCPEGMRCVALSGVTDACVFDFETAETSGG